MIKDIDQALAYYNQMAKRLGDDFPGAFLATRSSELAVSSTGLGLPENYLRFVRKYDVKDVTLGMLELTPSRAEDIFEVLARVNMEDWKNPLVGENFLHVANYEADLILVVKGDEMHDDSRVFFLDISTGFNPGPICIANSFEEFVVIAANLHQRGLDEQIAKTCPLSEVVKAISPSIDNKGQECWQAICEMYS